MAMAESRFVYVTYIRTTPEKLWQALTTPQFVRKYWMGVAQESEWKPGAPWRLVYPDGRVTDTGEVVEIDPPKRYVLKWRNEFRPELKAEGFGQMTCTLEKIGAQVKLTIVHEMPMADSKLIGAVSGGWPMILASLKSLLETGEALEHLRDAPKG
jgi:uncharacterized protein YndB with AHSA1/START domain